MISFEPVVDYYSGLDERLSVNEEHIHTLHEDRISCQNVLNDPDKSDREKRMAKYVISSLTSSASNDIFEEQLSKILGITNIDTKHGWDGNDIHNNEPYEYKPTKITSRNYLGTIVNINDESLDKINNISPHKKDFHNYKANFVIAPINKHTSEFICIYKFKEHILYRSRMDKLPTYTSRKIYRININKCIELSKKYNEKYYYWRNPKFIP